MFTMWKEVFLESGCRKRMLSAMWKNVADLIQMNWRLNLTVLAYNILRLIGQESLKSKRDPKTKHPVKRRCIRTAIGNLIQIAGHVTTHGRRIVLLRYVFFTSQKLKIDINLATNKNKQGE